MSPPRPLPASFFHCPAHKGLEGPAAPSPTPSPMAQAPWQRPRRQGGVCQRHLSLTSSITGHHGNTHDFNTRGSPCPALPLSLHRASAEPKLEAPVPLGSGKSQSSLPTPGPRFHQTKALRSLCLQHLPGPPHTHTRNTQQHPCPEMHNPEGLGEASEPHPKAKQGRQARQRAQTHACT